MAEGGAVPRWLGGSEFLQGSRGEGVHCRRRGQTASPLRDGKGVEQIFEEARRARLPMPDGV